MPPLDGLQVVRSSIHGYGVIALRRFRRGEIIIRGDGVVWRPDEDFDDTHSLLVYLGDQGDIEYYLFDLVDQTRWINHSCDPNTEVDLHWDPQTKSAAAWWRARRNIEPGEELSFDYAFSPEVAEPCYCGSPRCRGVIVEESEIENLPKKLRHLVRVPPKGQSNSESKDGEEKRSRTPGKSRRRR